ncbi:MAG: hypothetical protein BWX48_01818 [Verrucomicrobia bacterium ADurb.Bin006]|jgi:hypothetical protein|nr:MAG: hypothetical protein BWX48_01818 [Verrucomicrobia bacterium ADurb.Bin006]
MEQRMWQTPPPHLIVEDVRRHKNHDRLFADLLFPPFSPANRGTRQSQGGATERNQFDGLGSCTLVGDDGVSVRHHRVLVGVEMARIGMLLRTVGERQWGRILTGGFQGRSGRRGGTHGICQLFNEARLRPNPVLVFMGSFDIQRSNAHGDHEPICSRRRESALISAFDGARWRGLTSAATEPRFMGSSRVSRPLDCSTKV